MRSSTSRSSNPTRAVAGADSSSSNSVRRWFISCARVSGSHWAMPRATACSSRPKPSSGTGLTWTSPRCRAQRKARPRAAESTITDRPTQVPAPPIHRRAVPAMTTAKPATTGPPNRPAMLSTTVRTSKIAPGPTDTNGLSMLIAAMLPNRSPEVRRPAVGFCRHSRIWLACRKHRVSSRARALTSSVNMGARTNPQDAWTDSWSQEGTIMRQSPARVNGETRPVARWPGWGVVVSPAAPGRTRGR